MNRRVFSIILILLTTVAVYAGPFGLEMGWSYDDCIDAGFWPNETRSVPGYYWDCNPPNYNATFENYKVNIDDRFGVYFIEAATETKKTYGFDYYLLEDYTRLRDNLVQKYGEIHGNDWTLEQHIENPFPFGWIDDFLAGNRLVYSTWTGLDNYGLSEIHLEVELVKPDSYKIVLTYYSSDWDEVIDKHKQEEERALFEAL